MHFNPRSREGATILPGYFLSNNQISIHAPAKERRYTVKDFCPECIISIHAPAKERRRNMTMGDLAEDFNPRSREGATTDGVTGHDCFLNFNPRSREGATNGKCPKCGRVEDFNPRSREGATDFASVCRDDLLFQSTLPRRSDEGDMPDFTNYHISIHAPAKERQPFWTR